MAPLRQPLSSASQGKREDRRYPRVPTLKAGTITAKKLPNPVTCILRNLSSAGGCVEVFSEVHVPDEFTLSWDKGKTVRRCRVEWRSGNRVGVEFR